MQKTVPVFFTADEGYVPFLSVALTSLISHTDTSGNTQYRIIIVGKGLSEESKTNLTNMATGNVDIELYPMDADYIDSVSDDKNMLRADYITMTIYFRLFIPEMFPDIDKAIYLDSDTVINTDVAELYSYDLGDNLVAGVHDIFMSANKETTDYVENALGMPVRDYINSGMLLMNLKAMREEHFTEHFVTLLRKYHVECAAVDQDYLNVICRGRILLLAREWNTMMTDGTAGSDHPKIIHYNLFHKPWHYRHAANADYFWKYAEDSVYYPELLSILESFTPDEVSSDEQKKARLIRQVVSIPGNDVNFKKLADSGVKITL